MPLGPAWECFHCLTTAVDDGLDQLVGSGRSWSTLFVREFGHVVEELGHLFVDSHAMNSDQTAQELAQNLTRTFSAKPQNPR